MVVYLRIRSAMAAIVYPLISQLSIITGRDTTRGSLARLEMVYRHDLFIHFDEGV